MPQLLSVSRRLSHRARFAIVARMHVCTFQSERFRRVSNRVNIVRRTSAELPANHCPSGASLRTNACRRDDAKLRGRSRNSASHPRSSCATPTPESRAFTQFRAASGGLSTDGGMRRKSATAARGGGRRSSANKTKLRNVRTDTQLPSTRRGPHSAAVAVYAIVGSRDDA